MLKFRLNEKIIDSLSKNELNILKYVYENDDKVCLMSIQEFAQAVSYSPATILRFCKKAGYSGFAEFKYVLRSNAAAVETEPDVSSFQKHQSEILSANLFSSISATSSLISQDCLDRAFSYFDSDCPIYIFSPSGITEVACDYFEKMLFSIGRQNVYKTCSYRMCKHLLMSLKKDALLILISTSGNYEPTIRLAKMAQTNNIPILAITPYSNNNIASIAQINFRFFTDQKENHGAEFTSRLPILYIVSLIVNCYLNYKEKGERL